MPRVWSTTKRQPARQAGFSVIEVLLAAAVFGTLVVALVGSIVYGRSSAAESGNHQRATLLAQEGIEATRNIADAAYSNLTDGTFGLVQTSTQWTLSGSSDTDGFFTRHVTISTVSTNHRLITSTVTWPQAGGGTGSVVLTTRITNWAAALKLWSAGIQAGTVQPSGTTANLKVDVSGNYAYVVRNASSTNLAVVNMATPTAPTVAANLSVSGTPTNVAVSNGYLYITTGTNTSCLEIYSLASPTAPSLVKTLSFTGTSACRGVYVQGNYAYVVRASSSTTGANEFNVVNVTTPASASVVGGYDNNIQMNEVWVSGNFAYVATSSTTQEMLVVNINTPTAPVLAATYNPSTTLAALTITGFNNTVLLGMSTTLDAINVTTPTSPVRLGTYTASGTINDIDVDVTNLFAYVGTSATNGELNIVNIANPASMSSAKNVDLGGTSTSVAINGVAYNSSNDAVAAATASTTQGFVAYTRN
ncbi:MAG TPA: hypothetical protein VF466_02820 [Candidatus Saccharimonadales bacterium]